MTAPAYPPGAYRFVDREYLNTFYRTDPDALREVAPESLEIDDLLVRFGDERGEHLHAMYLDDFSPRASPPSKRSTGCS